MSAGAGSTASSSRAQARRASEGARPLLPQCENAVPPAAGKPSASLYTLPRKSSLDARNGMNMNIMNMSAAGWQPRPPRPGAQVRRDPITHKVEVYARGGDDEMHRLDTISTAYCEAIKATRQQQKPARHPRPKGVSEFVDLSAVCVSHENPMHKRALSADRRAFHRKRTDLKAQEGPGALVRDYVLKGPAALQPVGGTRQRPTSALAAGKRSGSARAPAASGRPKRPASARAAPTAAVAG
mmetsp:Transcript_75356/g.140526  ORF Transcript_75356/g.140526 Transcript_75356/m.140526 type:complete len:241 (+) Transcript_75356:83-805(+)